MAVSGYFLLAAHHFNFDNILHGTQVPKALTNRQYISALTDRKKAYENKYTPSIYRALRAQKKNVIDVAKSSGPLSALTAVNLINGDAIRAALIKLYTDISPKEARWQQRILNAIPLQAKAFGINLDFLADIADWLGRNILDKVVREITESTKNRMYKAIVEGNAAGDSYDDIVRKLEDTELDKSRARLIARTESNRATNKGHDLAREKYPYEVDKLWLAARDKRTRGADGEDKADHFHMNEQTVAEDAPFVDPRNGAQMMFPGDSSLGAKAADVCNCFLPNELTYTSLKNIKKVYRSFYDGKAVSIQATNGSKFTCTPNHPILTTQGWVAAGMLTEESRLVDSEFINEVIPSSRFEVNYTPTTFEQIFNSFCNVGNRVRKSGSVMDFYGDGSTGDVDIVSSNRQLWNWVKSFKLERNISFKGADVIRMLLFHLGSQAKPVCSLVNGGIAHPPISAGNQLKASSSVGLAHSQIHASATPTGGNASFFQSPANNLPRAIKLLGKFFNAETGIIEGYNFIDNVGCSKVQQITHTDYKGYVYTLETVSGLYDIDSAVAKNCRCNVRYNPKRDANGKLIMRISRITVPV